MTRAEAIERLVQRDARALASSDGEQVLQVLKRRYVGVVNEYLQRRLGLAERVVGPVEVLAPCRCCGYRTHDETTVECPVCFWVESSETSCLTLEQARANFESLGAVDEWSVDAVVPDARQRYAKELTRA